MTIIRQNGKVTTTTLALKRARRHARKNEARQTSEAHLAATRREAFYYKAKQSRRWLSARLLSNDRGSLTGDAASQLHKHFLKSEFQLQHPRINDAVLTADAKSVLSQLESEREAARSEQGDPERVQDWWAPPTMLGKKKRKKMMRKEKSQEAVTGGGDSDERVGDMELEEEGGEELAEEELEGVSSQVMLSPIGSVAGDEDEGEVE